MTQTFLELGLNPERVAELQARGYERPSKLQSELIPQLLAGKDIVAEAPPGSGKTVAYALPILQTLDPEIIDAQALVIVATSGDAVRVAKLFQSFNANPNIHVVPVFDDQPITRESERLRRSASVIIGVPKRLKEHLARESFSMDQVQIVVVDGADDLEEMNLQDTVEELLDQAPATRQTALLAGQLDEALQTLADKHLFEPVVLKREAVAVALPVIKHRYQNVLTGSKFTALLRLLDSENVDRALIFANLRPETERVAQALQAQGYAALALHHGSDADAREAGVRNWREGSIDFLVVTGGAARAQVIETPYAICFDIPTDAETYAEWAKLVSESGTLFTLLAARERMLLGEIESFLGLRVKAVLPPTRAAAAAQRVEAFKQRLRETINRSNLEMYYVLLNELVEEGLDWAEIAAAAVSLLQQPTSGEAPPQRRPERRPSAPSRYQETPRERERPSERERPPERSSRERDEDREVESGYVRLVMDAGYDIGVRPKDIVGAIANEANVPGRAVGNIDIRDHFTYVEVQEEYADRVVTRVPSTRLRGRVVTFRKA